MVKKTDTAKAETFYSEKLETPIEYSYSWTEYSEGEEGDKELVAANDQLTTEEQRKIRNTERKIQARQKAQTVAFKAAGLEKPTAETSDKVRAVDFMKNMRTVKAKDGSRKYTFEAVKALIADQLDIEWNDAWGTSFEDFGK